MGCLLQFHIYPKKKEPLRRFRHEQWLIRPQAGQNLSLSETNPDTTLHCSLTVKPVATKVRNPKSNGVVERVHLTMGDMSQIKRSPCHLAFNHDMIFCRAIKIDWDIIHDEHQKLVTASNQKENQSWHNKQYLPGDKVIIILDADECRSQPKMSTPTWGPFTITRVHTNRTVEFNCGQVTEIIDIRRIKPYYEWKTEHRKSI